MQYLRILALIDAEVERLQKARQLLASSFSPLKKTQKRKSPLSVQSAASEIAKIQDSPTVLQGSAIAPALVREKRAGTAQQQKTPSLSRFCRSEPLHADVQEGHWSYATRVASESHPLEDAI